MDIEHEGSARDGSSADAPPQIDLLPSDIGFSDLGPGPGCDPTLALVQTVNGKMVVCLSNSSTTWYNQCEASSLCDIAGGWILCPASTYRAAFGPGANPPPASSAGQAWVAGCVRDGGKLTLPTDGTCSCSNTGSVTTVPVGWSCATQMTTFNSSARQLGLATSQSCNLVGLQDPSTAGFWMPQSALANKRQAVCCHP